MNELREVSKKFSQLKQEHETSLERAAWNIIEARSKAYDEVYSEGAHAKAYHHYPHRYLATTGKIEIIVDNGSIEANLIELGCRGNADETVGWLTIEDKHLTAEGIEEERQSYLEACKKEQDEALKQQQRSKREEAVRLRKQLQQLEQEI